MDFHLKQWKNHQLETSEHQHSSKIPKLLISTHEQQQKADPSGSALPLFVSEPRSKISTLSAFPDSSSASTRYPSTGSYFSLSQWQELELQALIFRYMLAGSSVPPELLQPIKKSLLQSPSFFLHHPTLQHYSVYQPALFQTGYWGRGAMDPEPGRCRRTDGKKWRCSRDIVSGHKYCERHMHRGRNRSRKPVEIPTAPSSSSSGVIASSSSGNAIAATNLNSNPSATASGGTHFALSASIHQIQLDQSTSETKTENKDPFEPQNKGSGDGNSNGHILRHFFDDWPRSLQESENGGSNGSSMSSATCLSMSIPENSSSDVSLKLFIGNADHDLSHSEHENRRLSWAAGWPSNHMGGPLAEALRSSSSNASPTSVLNQLACGSVSEISFVSA